VFVASVTQLAKRMRRILLPSVACPAIPYCHLWPAPRYHIAICAPCPAIPYCHLCPPASLYHIAICGLPRYSILPSVACLAIPYCHLCPPAPLYHIAICGLPRYTILPSVPPAPLYNIFPHYLRNGTIFEGRHKMPVSIFSTAFV
jgi:hypothetical protein